MKYVVVYYTRTLTCQRIAETISKKLACEIAKIVDNENWEGALGFFKAGYFSSKGKDVKITTSGDLDHVDEYIVVTPLWAGGIAPATRVFLKTLPREKIHLVVSSIGNRVKDRSDYKSVSDITKIEGNEDLVINNLVKSLSKSTSE